MGGLADAAAAAAIGDDMIALKWDLTVFLNDLLAVNSFEPFERIFLPYDLNTTFSLSRRFLAASTRTRFTCIHINVKGNIFPRCCTFYVITPNTPPHSLDFRRAIRFIEFSCKEDDYCMPLILEFSWGSSLIAAYPKHCLSSGLGHPNRRKGF